MRFYLYALQNHSGSNKVSASQQFSPIKQAFLRLRRCAPAGAFVLWALLPYGSALAQREPPALTILVADFTAPDTRMPNRLSAEARDAAAGELAASGQAQFRLVPRARIQEAAKTLGMRLPRIASEPSNWTQEDWFRLGRELKADALVTGDVNTKADGKKGTSVSVSILVRDINEGDALNGASARQAVTPREGELDEEAITRGVSDAVLTCARQMLARPQTAPTVLTVKLKTITFNKGRRDGLHAGDELRVYRYNPNGTSASTGKVRLTHLEENDAEAVILTNNGIGPEDVARLLYRPSARK